MQCTLMEFYKAQKSPLQMEEKINETLLKGQFKFATQTECPHNGKITISLFVDPSSQGKVKAKVLRAVSSKDIQKVINDFLSSEIKPKMKFFTVTAVGNVIVGIVYYE